MSSTVRRPRGHHWVQFRCGGKKHTARLGKVPHALADQWRVLVDRLIACVGLGLAPDPELRAWLDRMGDGPRRTLVTAGLAPPRGARTVGDLCDRYERSLERRVEVKQASPATLANGRVVTGNLREHFGPDLPLERVDTEGAERFRRWLRSDGRSDGGGALAETTTSRRCRRAREIFAIAVDEGWLAQNPWRRLRNFRETDTRRDVYVPRATIEGVIAACPDRELRLVLGLARYVGIRVPSEMAGLLLADFDLERGVVRVTSPKTAYRDGQGERLAPIWPELEPLVTDVFEAALVGQTHALPHLGGVTGAAVTGRAQRACRAAGVVPWPKLWVNLRASCERDLLEKHPIDKVASWLGHSPMVALKHYSRVARQADASAAGTPPDRRESLLRVDPVASQSEAKGEAS